MTLTPREVHDKLFESKAYRDNITIVIEIRNRLLKVDTWSTWKNNEIHPLEFGPIRGLFKVERKESDLTEKVQFRDVDEVYISVEVDE